MSPVHDGDDRARELLRRGLGGLADESSSHPLDTSTLRTGALASARRTRVRRVAAGLAAAAATAVVLLGVGSGVLGRPGAQAPPAGLPSVASFFPVTPTPSPATTPPKTPAPTVIPRTTPGGVRQSTPPRVRHQAPLVVSLSVTSGPASADGTVFVAHWTISWHGGDAPATLVLLSDPTGPRARSAPSNSCRGSSRAGTVEGEVNFPDPGPHPLTAVVRVLRCDGTLQRVTDTVTWTWTGPAATPSPTA